MTVPLRDGRIPVPSPLCIRGRMPLINIRVIGPLIFLLVGIASSISAQTRTVELEVYIDQRAPAGTQHQWMETLSNCGADRVSVKVGKVKPAVEETALSSGSKRIVIKAMIERNRLQVSGSAFAITDKSGIQAFIKRLRDDGAETGLAEKKAFGLTSPQLVELHEKLSAPINFPTKGISAREGLVKVSNLLNVNFQLDNVAAEALDSDETVYEDLIGLSSGTAIAMMVRPLGLVFQPEREQGKSMTFNLVDAQDAKEHWPIGWPPQGLPVNVCPPLFEKTDLEIRRFPLKATLDAMEKRTKVPFIYDRNAISKAGIELDQVKVELIQDKITYMSAVSKLLGQSKPGLKQELRVDENGKPFLWITTLR